MGKLKTWVELNAERMAEHQQEIAERAQREAEAEQERKRQRYQIRGTPMVQRLQAIIEAMPNEERTRPRHISYFCQLLRSKYRTRSGRDEASPAEVGPGLKELGWTRTRIWLGAEHTFRTEWRPPEKADKGPIQPVSKRGNTKQPPKSRKAQRAA